MFCILLQKNETFSHSFTFFAKERNVLCVFLHSLQNNVAFFVFFYVLKKRTQKNVAFFKRTEKNDAFRTEKNAVPYPGFFWLKACIGANSILFKKTFYNCHYYAEAGLGICSFAHCSFTHFAQIKWATVSDSLRSLRGNEWIAHVAQDKWVTLSDSLRSLRGNEGMSTSLKKFWQQNLKSCFSMFYIGL